ncbi:MAG: 30S ribosomal protein S21 [Candidatus Pelagibacter sp.]|nr:30S ribosomal protein S21 [Candidatus Pelagibacter sp.]OUV86710.1 MAG: 30S ribosomal protein S21 [Pelagibacteraceae bacterium TMED136]|tara:strand:+ start:28 stop:345 length:318 start_codon:yes stop_codon:yes gene_type:complete
MDFSKMLKQAQEMQQKMMEAKNELKNIVAEGASGGGTVKIQMNGHFEVVKVNISEEILKEDKGVIEDLIIAATNNAKKEVEGKTQDEMSKITGGIKMPPGFKFPM